MIQWKQIPSTKEVCHAIQFLGVLREVIIVHGEISMLEVSN